MAQPAKAKSLIEHFSALEDPRQSWKVTYPLPEVLLLVLCGTLAGADDFVEIRLWGTQNLAFLRRFYPFADGIPSHDTLGDVINALDPKLFKECFAAWIEALRGDDPDIVAIDGKTSRRSHARSKGRDPLHLVSAWASRQRLVLGQQAVTGKSNEIEAIPLLLERLALTGALVTIDAIGCQDKIAQTILAKGGDYILALEAAVERDGKATTSRRYYLSSAKLPAETFARAVRSPWGIENRLHWVLDVVFHDDLARLRTGHGPENMAIVRHMAINLVRQAKPTTSLKNRRKLASWNPDYLETLIRQSA